MLPIDAPRHKGLLSVNVQPVGARDGDGKIEAGRKLNNPSGAYMDAGNITTLGAKAIFTRKILERLDAELAGMNLTDKNYWLSEGFPESGHYGAVQPAVQVLRPAAVTPRQAPGGLKDDHHAAGGRVGAPASGGFVSRSSRDHCR